MQDITILTYTHSKCSDLHVMYYDSYKKYFPEIEHIALSNEVVEYPGVTTVLYDDQEMYYQHMLRGISKISTDYIIYSQEDYILYDYVNKVKIKEYLEIMKQNSDIMFIRLIKSGIDKPMVDFNLDLLEVDSSHTYYYSTQVTLWRKSDLRAMFELSKAERISSESKNSPYLSSFNKIGLCIKAEGERVGDHYNSKIYPYIATALIQRKWNTKEYGIELEKLFKKYNIDKEIRGCY